MRLRKIMFLALAVTAVACGDGGPVVIDDPDVVSIGPLGLSEKRILAEVDGDKLLISFPFVNTGETSARVQTSVVLRGLDGVFTSSDQVDGRIPAAGGKVEVTVDAPENVDQSAVRAVHIIEYTFDTQFGRPAGKRAS